MKKPLRALVTAAIALACLEAGVASAQQPPRYTIPDDDDYRGMSDEVREAFRRGFDRGYDRGFRKGYEEGRSAVVVVPPPAPPPQAIPTGPIRVTSAFYGNESRRCDATRFVSRQSNGRAEDSFEVTNGICGDPAPGARKQLEVTYFCGGIAKEASAYEHRTIYLACP